MTSSTLARAFQNRCYPLFEDLPIVRPLPDPFEWSDGSGRSTKFSDWSRRRAEIKAEIEHYGIGEKPARPDDVTASYSDGTLTVNVTVNGETLTVDFPDFASRRRRTVPGGDWDR